MYVYVCTSGVAHVCAFVHVHVHMYMYVLSMTYIRICICVLGFMCLACVGPAMRATRTYIHTYDVAACCVTVGTTPLLLGCDESAHRLLLGFTCLACIGLAMRATRAYIRTNDVVAHCATVAGRHRYSCAMTRFAHNCKLIHPHEALLALCVLLAFSSFFHTYPYLEPPPQLPTPASPSLSPMEETHTHVADDGEVTLPFLAKSESCYVPVLFMYTQEQPHQCRPIVKYM